MTHTYCQLLYHLVWSTKERRPFITDDLRNRLYEYLVGTFRSLKCNPILIGGVADHVHCCVEVPPVNTIADVMREVKISSSRWVHQNFPVGRQFEWQPGYGAFTVSPSSRDAVLQYIRDQQDHHKKHQFRDEFLWLLQNHGVQYDEKYLWK